tara:strand:- start:1644 stop:2486 length:843 start_codon:yes stop_codon:yes gene_type:complete
MSLIIQNGKRNDLNEIVLNNLWYDQKALILPWGSAVRDEKTGGADADPRLQVGQILDFYVKHHNNPNIKKVKGVVFADTFKEFEKVERHIYNLGQELGDFVSKFFSEFVDIVSPMNFYEAVDSIQEATFTYIGGGCPSTLKDKIDEIDGLQDLLVDKAKTSTVAVYSAGMVAYLDKFSLFKPHKGNYEDALESQGPIGVTFIPHIDNMSQEYAQAMLFGVRNGISRETVALSGNLVLAVDISSEEVTHYESLDNNAGVQVLGVGKVQNLQLVQKYLSMGR